MNANVSHDAIDSTIDRALSALRDAQPRSGLEGRILASLEHRADAPQPTRFHISAHLALWAATSAAIIAVASMIVLRQHGARAPQNSVILSEASPSDAQSKNPETARLTTNLEPSSTTNPSRTAHTVSSRPERAARSGETCISDHPGCSVDANDVTTTPTDTQLLADLHAPSHPAPPLPLTPQEKLFLRMVRYGNLTELAELNPVVRAQHDDDETAAFKAFFPDPPPLQQPNGDTE